ncbi:pyridoxamine 5'-phosphate oxidase-related FMN-binding protein [Hyphomicrobium denitrificans ATCC 51888]|uniref:Pyridoxamine 5'-phosphate oxidase-related FMN-binding protein n=1 Tax=Hyphomicrobium denitrificans (strain ATCC 51888 / DSM 1869 / NCIMB 11706 / TK 0415) TaxID=582899 RepID=D8JW90_HYPDA|nr:pyridoxamine 5'-phosphate oxidase family protein [Hyphomicrobium denitrificans]ADJ24969.1 pyridoxamine 5'-phosphate oxidase-related FMN-binding protein [Hyphomicrobium denitrificans ATCC 51888]
MSRLFGDIHRALQMAFDTRALADRIEAVALKPEIDETAKAFIESREMFFLSTIDHMGRPTVSYKGGAKGFVRVVDQTTLMFPSYDGNGMYLSMGNISGNAEIGMLFIDFEKPFRLRAQGRAELIVGGEDVKAFKEAEMVVKVSIHEVWMNCPRYVHRFKKIETSRYAPGVEDETPFCEWKRIDAMQDVVRPDEREKVEQLGTTTIDDWMGKVMSGDRGA